MTSSDICAALRERYKQPEWSLFFEVANGTGANTKRHADALAMNMYPSRGLSILGFEIKVSRSDLKRELVNPDKAEEIARFCNEWWLVVPKDLIRDDDNIPVPWGVMECDSGILRVKKKPQALNPKPVTKEFVAAVLRSAGKVDEETIQQAKAAAWKEQRQSYQEQLEREVKRRTERFERIKEKVDEFEKATGCSLNHYTDIEGLAERMKLAKNIEQIYGRYGSLQSVKFAVEKFLKDVDELMGPIKKAV